MNMRIRMEFKGVAKYWVHYNRGFPPTDYKAKGIYDQPYGAGENFFKRTETRKNEIAGDGGSVHQLRYSNDIANSEYNLTFSPQLAFVLGFKKERYEPICPGIIEADYLPDVYGGIDRIFIYCEIENQILGGEKSNLLISLPLQVKGQTQGGATTFFPAKTERKVKRMMLNALNISVRNFIGELMPFDSGSLSIKAILQ